MPEISSFYGIKIIMHQKSKEHNPPHIHANYSGRQAIFSILDGSLIDGSFPAKGKNLVKEFIELYREQLLAMWETGEFTHLPGLD